ncbi:hypothetical protein J1N35_045971 [Gossypium stocksii]|uniref:Uncharacterized protein n=1 Tax=Gossypium stocksii TaxID=47602 RepID=A0A9D3UCH8_9ROSI|nr:hypothetical protein J1N35_045971 [Gossypium stocksii]
MFDEHVSGDNLIEFLNLKVQQGSQADCWMQLYNRWSCLDDIGSLAVIHQMLVNDPGKSLLRFRQFLLLLIADESISIQRSFEAFFLKAYILADTSLGPESSYVIQLLEEAIRCPSDGLRKGQALNNLGSIYVDRGKLDETTNCYMNALEIKHTRAHQGLARIHFSRNQRKAAYDEMSKLIEKACSNALV